MGCFVIVADKIDAFDLLIRATNEIFYDNQLMSGVYENCFDH